MDYNNLILSCILLIIPLVLLILYYRSYKNNYCNNIKCKQDNLIKKLEEITGNVKDKREYIQDKINKSNENLVNDEVMIEGFFGGLTDWFSGSTPTKLPVSNGLSQIPNINSLEKKISHQTLTSNTFPPQELNGNNEDFKDSNNNELLNQIGNKNKLLNSNKINNIIKPNTLKDEPKTIEKLTTINTTNLTNSSNDLKKILGSCQFYNDKCPDKYQELGNFSINGVGSNTILACGNVQNVKPAHAIAQIKNNSIYEIHITDPGHGFNPKNPPKISIEGGKGHGATADAVIDDNGYLKLIKIINPGYNYSETPNVLIDAPFLNSSCHLCCQL